MKTTEVGPVFHLLSEDVTMIALAYDMEDLDEAILNPFAGSVVSEFKMAHILHGGSVGPIHGYFVVIVD